jgi:hypothetical protein
MQPPNHACPATVPRPRPPPTHTRSHTVGVYRQPNDGPLILSLKLDPGNVRLVWLSPLNRRWGGCVYHAHGGLGSRSPVYDGALALKPRGGGVCVWERGGGGWEDNTDTSVPPLFAGTCM